MTQNPDIASLWLKYLYQTILNYDKNKRRTQQIYLTISWVYPFLLFRAQCSHSDTREIVWVTHQVQTSTEWSSDQHLPTRSVSPTVTPTVHHLTKAEVLSFLTEFTDQLHSHISKTRRPQHKSGTFPTPWFSYFTLFAPPLLVTLDIVKTTTVIYF